MHKRTNKRKSNLLNSTLPYQWIFTLLTLTQPPIFYANMGKHITQQQLRLARLCFACYCLLVLLISFCVTYFNNVFITLIVQEYAFDSLIQWFSIAQNICVSLIILLLQLTALLKSQQHCQIFINLIALETDIAAQQDIIPTTTNEHYSFRWRLACYSGALLAGNILLWPLLQYRLVSIHMAWWGKCLTVCFSLLIQIKFVEYCVTVQMLYDLLLKLEQQLQQLRHELSICEKRRLIRAVLYVELQSNKRLLLRLWQLVCDIEAYFALPMTLIFLQNGLIIIQTAHWSYIADLLGNDYFRPFRFGATALVLANMLTPCWLSQLCIDKYNQMSAQQHNIKPHGSDMLLINIVREYSLQLMHLKLLFTCGGYFDINLKYFGLMVLTITTFMVILLQFKLEGQAEKETIQL